MNAEKATCTPDGPDIALIRLLPDGRLGTGFGDGGRVVHDVGGEGNNGRAVLVQPDGRLLVGGSAARNSDTPNPGQDGTVTRFTASGSVDGSFGRSGTAIISAGTDRVRVTDIVLQPDGKVVVAGCVRCATETQDELIARLTPAGALDTSFGEGGVVVTDFPAGGWVGSNRADGVALQNDGSIAATGCGHCLFTLSITTPQTVTRYLGDDVVPPQTTIDTGPSGPTNDPSPTFTFSADQQSTFECSLDRGAPTFAPCASGDSFGPLPEGAYTFRVRATDPGGNTDPTPAERRSTST